MKILFVASECAPFIKTGGLADVIGAVPKALAPLGGDVRVLLPAYPALAAQVSAGKDVLAFDDLFGGPARVVAVQAAGVNVLLLDAPHLFDRAGNIYLDGSGQDWPDNYLRFGALSWVGAQIAAGAIRDWQPDVVNAHDWQAGLVPVYLRAHNGPVPPVVLTVHNIAFQGVCNADKIDALRLDPALFTQDGYEYWGKVSFLKGGLALADRITTVSPTYARELMLPTFGAGLEGVLNARKGDLAGILNGIDLDVWNPATDAALPAPYTARTVTKKAQSRVALAKRFGLDAREDGPLFCVVSRLTEQKGLDLLLDCLPVLAGAGAQLAVLGTGDKRFEAGFVDAARRYPGTVGTIIGYDETLSHLMQGGADAILIPSRFEPCGLTQLYGLRYGTIPVVARTGGLADTVIDANPAALAAKCATGLQFSPVTVDGLAQAILRTCDLYQDPKVWRAMMRRAMAHPVGWDQSASAYMALYSGLCGQSA